MQCSYIPSFSHATQGCWRLFGQVWEKESKRRKDERNKNDIWDEIPQTEVDNYKKILSIAQQKLSPPSAPAMPVKEKGKERSSAAASAARSDPQQDKHSQHVDILKWYGNVAEAVTQYGLVH